MPRVDGEAVLRKLREDDATADLPVVMWTSVGDAERRARFLDLGADDCLPKPLDPERFLTRVQAALRRRRG